MDEQEIPKVKELITYYETAAAEDRQKAESLRRKLRRVERQEKRRSRNLSRLQEMSLPKIRKNIKVSSPSKSTPSKKRREEVVEPVVEEQISLAEGVELAPLPTPLFGNFPTPSPFEEPIIVENDIDNLISECTEIMETPAEIETIEPEVQMPASDASPMEIDETKTIVVQKEEEMVPESEEAPEKVVEVAEEPAPVAAVAVVPKDSMRTLVAREILATEKTYVEGLRNAISLYMMPLNGKLEDSEIHTLFGNMPNILRLNEALLGQLDLRLSQWTETALLGDIFIEVAPFFSMYADYCSSYENAVQMVVKLKQSSSVFISLVEKNVPICGGLDIHDLLILPVQRVPRYRLLLENLVKYTPEDHPDHPALKEALTAVSDKAAEINQKMALQAQQRKMMELALRFETSPVPEGLVQPYRHLVSEFVVEWIPSHESPDAKNIHMFLFNDIMVLAPVPKQSDDKLEALGAYQLWSLFLKKLDDNWTLSKRENPPFQLVHSSATYNLFIANNDEKQKFKVDLESSREKILAAQPLLKAKRLAIKLEMNPARQEWTAVEPAPTFASRITRQSLEREAATFTQKALEELLRENKQTLENMTPVSKTPKKSRLFAIKETIVNTLSPLVPNGRRRESLFGFGSPSNRYATMPKLDSGALFAAAAESLTNDAPLSAGSKPANPEVSAADMIRQQIDELNKKAAEISKKDKKREKKRKRQEEAEAVAAEESAKKAEKRLLKASKSKKFKPVEVEAAVEAVESDVKEEKKKRKHKKEKKEAVEPSVVAESVVEEKSSKKKSKKKHHDVEVAPEAPVEAVEDMMPEKKRRKKKETHTDAVAQHNMGLAAALAEEVIKKSSSKKHKREKSSEKENAADNAVVDVPVTPRVSKKRKAHAEATHDDIDVSMKKKTKRSKTSDSSAAAVAGEPAHLKGKALKMAN